MATVEKGQGMLEIMVQKWIYEGRPGAMWNYVSHTKEVRCFLDVIGSYWKV